MTQECKRCHQLLEPDEFRRERRTGRRTRVCIACELETRLKRIYARRRRRRDEQHARAAEARACLGEKE